MRAEHGAPVLRDNRLRRAERLNARFGCLENEIFRHHCAGRRPLPRALTVDDDREQRAEKHRSPAIGLRNIYGHGDWRCLSAPGRIADMTMLFCAALHVARRTMSSLSVGLTRAACGKQRLDYQRALIQEPSLLSLSG